jgi:hypothetical protein
MSNGAFEARAAARWWADQLTADEPHRTGDAMSEAFATFARSKTAAPTADQVETFRASLEAAILRMLRGPDSSWEAAVAAREPRWGAAFRTVATDYGPEGILKEAAEAAGINTLLLPVKTCMWVNPGSVRVSHGYNSAEVEVDLDVGVPHEISLAALRVWGAGVVVESEAEVVTPWPPFRVPAPPRAEFPPCPRCGGAVGVCAVGAVSINTADKTVRFGPCECTLSVPDMPEGWKP